MGWCDVLRGCLLWRLYSCDVRAACYRLNMTNLRLMKLKLTIYYIIRSMKAPCACSVCFRDTPTSSICPPLYAIYVGCVKCSCVKYERNVMSGPYVGGVSIGSRDGPPSRKVQWSVVKRLKQTKNDYIPPSRVPFTILYMTPAVYVPVPVPPCCLLLCAAELARRTELAGSGTCSMTIRWTVWSREKSSRPRRTSCSTTRSVHTATNFY